MDDLEIPDRFTQDASPRRLSKRRYLISVLIAGSLALGQLLTFPVFLSPQGLGALVISISMTQLILQLGDFGFANAATRSNVGLASRIRFREYALSITYLSGTAGIIFLVTLQLIGLISPTILIIASIGIATGVVLVGGKLKGLALNQTGDLVKANQTNLKWQNAPKLGQILFSLSTLPVFSAVGGLLSATLFLGLRRPHVIPRFRYLYENKRYWTPGFYLAASAYLITWADSLILSGLLGLQNLGEYQAVMRTLGISTFVYVPLLAILQNNIHEKRFAVARRTAWVAFAISGAVIIVAAIGLMTFGPTLWPRFNIALNLVIIGSISSLASCGSAILGTYLLVSGRQVRAATATLLGFVVIAVIAPFSILRFGTAGAAVSSLLGWLVVVLIQISRSRRQSKISSTDSK